MASGSSRAWGRLGHPGEKDEASRFQMDCVTVGRCFPWRVLGPSKAGANRISPAQAGGGMA